jgi:hypothetical protein
MHSAAVSRGSHVVISFASADDASAAVLMLQGADVAADSVACYTPAQMQRPAALGSLGLPAYLLTAQRELARHGYSIVAARGVEGAMVQAVACIARATHAHSAHCCGHFRVHELIAPAPPVAATSGLARPGRRQAAASSFAIA